MALSCHPYNPKEKTTMLMFQVEAVPVVISDDPTTFLVSNIPTFLNTFLIFWNLRQSRKNQARLQSVERQVTWASRNDEVQPKP